MNLKKVIILYSSFFLVIAVNVWKIDVSILVDKNFFYIPFLTE